MTAQIMERRLPPKRWIENEVKDAFSNFGTMHIVIDDELPDDGLLVVAAFPRFTKWTIAGFATASAKFVVMPEKAASREQIEADIHRAIKKALHNLAYQISAQEASKLNG